MPAPSCLVGQMSPSSEDWHTGGRKWAGSESPLTCRPSDQTWGHNRRKDLASRVRQSFKLAFSKERDVEIVSGQCVAGVGSSPYVMNCNVTIDTQDIALGRSIATAIRESTLGGLPGVQVLALPHEGAVEIACNVESVTGCPPCHEHSGDPWPSFSINGQMYCHVPASVITARVTELAGRHGVRTKSTALVGFTPRECRGLAELALTHGIAELWKELHKIRM